MTMNMAEYGSQRLKPQNVNCESIIRGLKKISFKNPFHIYKIQLQKKIKGVAKWKMEKVMKNFYFFNVDVVVCLNGSDDDDVHNHFSPTSFPNILFVISFGENLGCG